MMTKDKPNILFIMVDQLRFDYLGYHGSDFVKTPNIDRLASRGMQFTNCFTNSPLCVPARVALATGLHPGRMGVLNNNSYLPPNIPTFYQRFRDNGYRVGCIGKLDLAKPDPYNGRYGDRPCAYQWGFTHPEECEGKMHAGMFSTPQGPYAFHLQDLGLYNAFHQDYTQRSASSFALDCRDSVLPTEAFADVYIGSKAVQWLNWVPSDFPWFYFISFVGPHNPYDPPTEYADKYRNAVMPEPIKPCKEGKPTWIHKRMITDDEGKIAETRRQYCASIEVIDDQVGLILDELERSGMHDHTYIIFTSDHGEMIGDHGIYTKSVAYEPSIHVPLIVAGADIDEGQVSDALVELIDLNATACDLAELPSIGGLTDALSILPLLKGESVVHREDIVSCEGNFRCIRNERYKYIDNFNDISELYDMLSDPHERNNIAMLNPEIVKELSGKLVMRFLSHSTYRNNENVYW
jgi:arylsulfatase